MDYKSVRAGNIVKDKDGSITTISGDITFFECANYDGVELNEEWLIEAGFEEVLSSHPAPNHRAFEIGCIHVKLYNHGELKVAVWVNEVPLLPHRHWYLHNIQNLHHSLSGEDLEFKL